MYTTLVEISMLKKDFMTKLSLSIKKEIITLWSQGLSEIRSKLW